MSASRKVVWSDGLFLQPQHFQQQERYLEQFVELRCHPLVPYSWGLTSLEINADDLRIGKFSLKKAAGVFPDGTPLRMPDDDPVPAAIDIKSDDRDQVLYLAVPLRRAGAAAVARPTTDALVRYDPGELEVRDNASEGSSVTRVEVGALRTRLLVGHAEAEAYACIPIAHLVQRRPDGQVVLSDQFIPTVMDVRAAPVLSTFNRNLRGLMNQRGDELAQKVTAGRGGSAEIAGFLRLQTINRYQPVVEHFANAPVHPEMLFRLYISAAGDLAALTTKARRPPPFPEYRHERLRESFEPVMRELERALTEPGEDVVVPIPVEKRSFGVWLARVANRDLFTSATFVLGVRTEVDGHELSLTAPKQLKIGPPDLISKLVNSAVGSIKVRSVPADRRIPIHNGFVYFEFDQSDELWKKMQTAGAMAFHLGREFSEPELELWAVRGAER
jgi:type VI secretion system protein ImpJ